MTKSLGTTVLSATDGRHQHALKLFEEGNYAEAARVLDGVLRIAESSEFWNDWATAQLMCNQVIESEYGYRRALEIDPSNVSAAGNLGVLLSSTARVPEALLLLERAVSASTGRERDALLGVINTCHKKLSTQGRKNSGIACRAKDCQSERAAAKQQSPHDVSAGREGETKVAGGSAVSSQASSSHAGVCFRGHIYGGSGYAEEAWPVALGISESQIPMQLVPVGPTTDAKRLLPDNPRRTLETLQHQRIDLSQGIFLQFAVADAWDMETFGRWCVARAMFETDRLPDGVAERCNAMDEVWVASRFNLETYVRAGVKESKLRYVPPGVDTHLFCQGVVPLQIPRKRGFNFLSVFDWHQRKGYDVLLRAYLQEFKPDEDVSLVLKVSQFNSSLTDLQGEITYFVERSLGLRLEDAPPIILVNGFIPQQDIPRLYATADCFVLPTRGEGYGRPFLEALSCQVPVIATGWSGQSDFLTQVNSYPIGYKLVPVPEDVDVEVFAGHRWAEPDLDHLRHLMRHVFSHQEEARSRAARGRGDMVRQYDWNVVIPQWVSELRRLHG